jgi:hypothetical protein
VYVANASLSSCGQRRFGSSCRQSSALPSIASNRSSQVSWEWPVISPVSASTHGKRKSNRENRVLIGFVLRFRRSLAEVKEGEAKFFVFPDSLVISATPNRVACASYLRSAGSRVAKNVRAASGIVELGTVVCGAPVCARPGANKRASRSHNINLRVDIPKGTGDRLCSGIATLSFDGRRTCRPGNPFHLFCCVRFSMARIT